MEESQEILQNISGKLSAWGAGSLTHVELLALLVEDGPLAERLLAGYGGSLARLGGDEVARLRMACGLGLRRAQRVVAAVELGRRIAVERSEKSEVIKTSDDVVKLYRPQLQMLSHEECWAVYLTSSNRIIAQQRVSQGGVQGTVVDHRLIVKQALHLLATQLILIHNHPSGAAEPSVQDKVLTEKIGQAAALFDIRLLDHLIISREGEFSFLREGLIG